MKQQRQPERRQENSGGSGPGSSKGRPKVVNLALQGGGAHGAFTWGVLDRLLEEPEIRLEGVSGTSAGAMNAVVLADGLTRGGREAAREALACFWDEVAELGRFGALPQLPFESLFGGSGIGTLMNAPAYVAFDAFSQFLSPYQFNPLNINPLLDLLDRRIDFERVRACDQVKLFISATQVRTGKIKIFRNETLNAKAVMASACLPQIFQAVEIDGEPYWDGGFMGNPAIYPLIYNCESRDVVLVQINPVLREETPRTPGQIEDRVNEITFNASLMRELRAIAFVARLLDEGRLDASHYKHMLIHRIAAGVDMSHLSLSSKYNAERGFLRRLHAIGRREAETWLETAFSALGERSTLDIVAEYL